MSDDAAGAAGADSRMVDGALRAIPVALPAAAFGFAVGLLAREAGLSMMQAAALSATTFAGSAQFAGLELLPVGGVVLAAGVGVLVNLRYVAIGFAVAPALATSSRPLRLLEAQLAIDETWALSEVRPGVHDRRLLLGAGLLLYVVWTAATLLGFAAGAALDAYAWGLDMAAPTIFLGLLLGHLRHKRRRVAAVSGAVVAVAATPLVGAGVGIALAAVVGLALRGARADE